MTQDAFEKAQELNRKLDMVHSMQNIITNSTLSADDVYYKAHNEHVTNDEMILCYMHRPPHSIGTYTPDVEILSDITRSDRVVLSAGKFHMGGNFVFGKDVPLDLVAALEKTLFDYEEKIQKEFNALTADYTAPEE